MVITGGNQTEKVTFNIPAELKRKVSKLKEEMHVSFSTIYNEAIAEYVRQKELEKWKSGANKALKDETYRKEMSEMGDDEGDPYAY